MSQVAHNDILATESHGLPFDEILKEKKKQLYKYLMNTHNHPKQLSGTS